ncbi:MAG: hypothetical protein ACOYXY_14745 [Thermodesulfobacteriota bacterium]
MKHPQKEWQTPKLVILARREPAESLTSYCKASVVSSGAGYRNNRCRQGRYCQNQCSSLHVRAS